MTSRFTADYIAIKGTLSTYSGSIPHENARIVFIGPANALDYLSRLLSCVVGLLARPRLLGVSVGIHREKLSLDVILDALQGLARGSIVTIDQGLEAVNRLDRVPALPGANQVLLEIQNQLVSILCELGELGLLVTDRGDFGILDYLLDTVLII